MNNSSTIFLKQNAMKRNYILFILLLLPILFAFKNQDSTDKAKQIINVQTTDTTGLSEAKAYRMLYDNQVKSNDAILKTIIYALSGLGGAALLVFASNWWFNDKKVKDIIKEIDTKIIEVKKDTLAILTEKNNVLSNEKTAEINKIQIKLQEEVNSAISNMALRFNEFNEKIRYEIKIDNKELVQQFQKQLETYNENYRQQIFALNETISAVGSNLKEQIETEKKNTSIELNSIKKTVYRNAYYLWDTKGVHRNSFAVQLSELELVLDDPSWTEKSLMLCIKQIRETIEKLTFLYDMDKDNAKAIFRNMPEQYQPIATELMEKIEKINIVPLLHDR
jgi:hypothetical protein